MKFLPAFGEPIGCAQFKSTPPDFQVSEIPAFDPCGEGEHLWLWIKKTNTNTAWVAEQLSKQSQLKLRDVSYAGRKDKIAVTWQWFSLYDPKRIADSVEFDIPNCEVIQAIRHSQKLRIGNLLGNEFTVHLRNFEGDIDKLVERLTLIKTIGFPNYFGAQRFGRNQANIIKATAWIERGAGRLKREQRSLYLSSLRSYLFNLILSQRVKDSTWNKILEGELVQLAGSKSIFVADKNDSTYTNLQERCDSMDVHPTGVLAGESKMSPEKLALACENSILNLHREITDFLIKETVSARRALRVLPQNMEFELSGNDIILKFSLPAGSYASVLVQNLVSLY